MTTDTQALSNRRNALLSTGPTSAAGRARSARNALSHGLYAAALVPALGETPEGLADLGAAVRAALRPDGPLEERLCDRVALLLVRLDRVTRFEAAVAARAAAAAAPPAPDPDAVTGDGVDTCVEPHPDAPPERRLAYARARVAGWRAYQRAFSAAAGALGGTPEPADDLPYGPVRAAVFEVGAAFGWGRDETLARWRAATGTTTEGPLSIDQFPGAVRTLAGAAGRDPVRALEAVRARLLDRAGGYDGPIAEREAEAAGVAAEMRDARGRSAGAAALADPRATDTVVRLEAHLTRQLGLTLDLLARVRGAHPGGGRGGVAGLLRELGAPPLVVG